MSYHCEVCKACSNYSKLNMPGKNIKCNECKPCVDCGFRSLCPDLMLREMFGTDF